MRFFFLSFFLLPLALHAAAPKDSLMDIINAELQREFAELKQKAETPPYYMSYRVEEVQSAYASASLGNITSSGRSRRRSFTPEVRIGSYERDNTHELRDEYGSATVNHESTNSVYLPIENVPLAIQQRLWLATDAAYKAAESRHQKMKANTAVKVQEDDASPDFTTIKPEKHIEPHVALEIDLPLWEDKVRRYSLGFASNPDILSGRVSFSHRVVRKYFVSTEGTQVAHNMLYTQLSVQAIVKADNGGELPLQQSYFAYRPEGLPADSVVMAEVARISAKLSQLRDAPEVDAFSGPALLSAAATGVFFHEIFGHRIEGQRLRSESDGQTFKKKVGQEVLATHLSVIMDPTIKQFQGQDLNGHYLFDDQGVRGQQVNVVDKGILQGFLMSRTPIEGFPVSNGHGRAAAGKQPVTRQSNLIVHNHNPKTNEELRQLLLDEIRKQGKEYGYYFASVVGGFTTTGRYSPNSFNVTPTEVYRVYADGRPDQLVRGVTLVGTPLAMFAQVGHAGGDYEIFSGQCGAESGYVPVTAIAPSVLVRTIEIQKKAKVQTSLPILPRP